MIESPPGVQRKARAEGNSGSIGEARNAVLDAWRASRRVSRVGEIKIALTESENAAHLYVRFI